MGGELLKVFAIFTQPVDVSNVKLFPEPSEGLVARRENRMCPSSGDFNGTRQDEAGE
jgi:hypothetical protein